MNELPSSSLITNDDIVLDIVNALNINEGNHGNIAEIVMGEDNDCNVPSQYEGDLQEDFPIPTLTNLSEELPANEMMTETHCSYSEEKDVDNETGLAENLIDLTFKFPSDPFNLERLLLNIGPCQPGKDNDCDFPNTCTSTRKLVHQKVSQWFN